MTIEIQSVGCGKVNCREAAREAGLGRDSTHRGSAVRDAGANMRHVEVAVPYKKSPTFLSTCPYRVIANQSADLRQSVPL